VDDNPVFREAASRYLARVGGAIVVGPSASGEDGLRLCEREAPHLVLLDLAMPGMDGIECARRMKALAPAPTVVIVTAHDIAPHAAAAAAARVDGFISKWEFMQGVRVWLACPAPSREAANDE
jgi:two-component system response regulator AlgR